MGNSVTDHMDVCFTVKDGTNGYLQVWLGLYVEVPARQWTVVGQHDSSVKPNRQYISTVAFGHNAEYTGIVRILADGSVSVYSNVHLGSTLMWGQLRFYA